MNGKLDNHIRNRATWLRGLYILLFVIIYSITKIVIGAVVIFQFLSVLFTGACNNRLLKFGQSLSTYVYQIIQFLTYNAEDRPYPFGTWPNGPPPARSKRSSANVKTGEKESDAPTTSPQQEDSQDKPA